MYNITIKEDNDIVAVNEHSKFTGVRPVFYEELDLLGFDQYWNYPKTDLPLLWRKKRTYYNGGEIVANVKGGNLVDEPQLNIHQKDLTLEEITIWQFKPYIQDLGNTAIDFVSSIFDNYPEMKTIVGYSGGKDSTVLLHIIQNYAKIPKDSYDIIHMELDNAHEWVEQTVPSDAITVKADKTFEEYVKEFGLPSRMHRWCTKILKETPFNLEVNEPTLLFEGVRADESASRSDYLMLAKHSFNNNVMSARPLLNWNSTEIWAYTLLLDLPINPLYRYGLDRLGCELCPFQSNWNEIIYPRLPVNNYNEYKNMIINYAKDAKGSVTDYLREGYWRNRGGGKFLNKNEKITQHKFDDKLYFEVENNKGNIKEWLKIIPYKTTVYLKSDGFDVLFEDLNAKEKSVCRKIIKKATYCTECRLCESLCPTGALTMNPHYIDEDKCEQCHECIIENYHGCIRSKSLA